MATYTPREITSIITELCNEINSEINPEWVPIRTITKAIPVMVKLSCNT
jgi:hypothetical protein